MRVKIFHAQLDHAVAGFADDHARARSLDDDAEGFLVAFNLDTADDK